MAQSQRCAAHQALAEALERRRSADAGTRTIGLARHFLEAAPSLGIERAVPFVVAAAERAIELQAHDQAVQLLERALGLVDLAGDDGATRIDLLLALGGACMRAGDGVRGTAACVQAAKLARGLGDSERLARAALAYGERFTFAALDGTLIALLQEALEACGTGATGLRARLLARLSAALQPAADPTVPMGLAREAIALAREVGDPATRLGVLMAAGSALAYFGDPAERLAIDGELAEIAQVLGDRIAEARALVRIVFDQLERGDMHGADAAIDAHASVVEALRMPSIRSAAALWGRLLCEARPARSRLVRG